MQGRATTVVGAAVLGLLALAVAFVLGMRAKSPAVLRAIRRLNRAVLNPEQMKTAGTPGAYASVVRHTGRRSGTPYETPVGAVAAGDGFVIALPYGEGTDWLKNVLASGSAVIVRDGRTYEVDRPEVVPMADAADAFPVSERRAHRLFGVDRCLRLRRVEREATAT